MSTAWQHAPQSGSARLLFRGGNAGVGAQIFDKEDAKRVADVASHLAHKAVCILEILHLQIAFECLNVDCAMAH